MSLCKLQQRSGSHASSCAAGTWHKASNLSVTSAQIKIAGGSQFFFPMLLLGCAGVTPEISLKLLKLAGEVMGPDFGSRAALTHTTMGTTVVSLLVTEGVVAEVPAGYLRGQGC